MNSYVKGVRKLKIEGQDSRLEVEGYDFQQFSPFRSSGLFGTLLDYRITLGEQATQTNQ